MFQRVKCAFVHNTTSKAMHNCVCVCVCVTLCEHFSLCLGQASSLSACGLDAVPHSLPIILFSPGASLSCNSPPRWDEVITLRTLPLPVHPMCVCVCMRVFLVWWCVFSQNLTHYYLFSSFCAKVLQSDTPVYRIIRQSCYKHHSSHGN